MSSEVRFEQVVAVVNEAREAVARGEFREAIDGQRLAIELAQQLGRKRLHAVLYMQLGHTFVRMGDEQRAVTLYELGFESLSADPALLATMLEQALGKEYLSPSIAETATVVLDLYTPESSTELNDAANDPQLTVKLLINIGNAYLQINQSRPARSRYEMALAQAEISPLQQAIAYTHLGQITLRSGELAIANDHLERALTLFEAAGETAVLQRKAIVALAGVRHQQQRFDEAQSLYQQAVAHYREAQDGAGEQKVLVSLGHIARQRGEWESAETHFTHAQTLQPPHPNRQLLALLHWGLGDCQWRRDALTEAVASLEESIQLAEGVQSLLNTDEGKVAYLDSVQEIYDTLLRVYLGLDDSEKLLALLDRLRGRAFHDLFASRRAAQDRREVNQKMAGGVQIEQPEPFFSVQQVAPSQAIAPPRIDEPLLPPVARREPPADRPMARLVFYILPEQTIVVAVSADGTITHHTVPISEADLTNQLTQLRTALSIDTPTGMDVLRDVRILSSRRMNETTENYRTILQTMYAQLIAPIAPMLPDDGETPIIIEPHGVLWLLPFAALLDSDDRYLSERVPLLMALSHHSMQTIRAEPDYAVAQSLSALIIGNPEMPQVEEREGLQLTLRPLAGAEAEAQLIAQHFPQHTLLLHEAATESAVRAHLPTHQVIHLATHGIAYSDDPNSSFVALGKDDEYEGVLTVRDVLQEVVSADLVALSACQTGLGRLSGDGVIGLGRAFLAIGARSVLVSQWNVSDQATTHFMQQFYQSYVADDDKLLALHKTMQTMREQPDYQHPRYWAAFMLLGVDQ